MSTFALTATNRKETGKADIRRLRRLDNMVPAIIYGGKEEPQNIKLPENEVLKAFSMDGIRSQVFELNLEGKATPVIVKDSQAHPTKPKIMHIDFLRVDMNKPVTMAIPLNFIGDDVAPGIKEGGLISHTMTELELTGLPNNLPESIEVDISEMHLGDRLHITDIKLPANVSLASAVDTEHDASVVVINKPKAEVEETDEAAADGSAEKAEGDGASAGES